MSCLGNACGAQRDGLLERESLRRVGMDAGRVPGRCGGDMEGQRRRGLKPGGGAIGPGVHGMARNLHLSKELMQERLEMSEMGR